MRGVYLVLRWMWLSLAMINPYRVTVGVIGGVDSREAGGWLVVISK